MSAPNRTPSTTLPPACHATVSLPATHFAFDRQHGLWLADTRCLRRLDLRSGHVARHPLPLDLEQLHAMAVAPDGSQLVLSDRERSLHVRAPLDAAGLRRADLYVTGVADAAYDPSGRWLALAHSEEGLLLVDAQTMEPRWAGEFIASQQPVLRFSDDASRVAVNTCEAVVVFDVDTGAQLARVERPDEALFTWATDRDLSSFDLAVDCGARLYRARPETVDDEDSDDADEPTAAEAIAFERLHSPTMRSVALVREAAGTLLAATSDATIARLGDGPPHVLARVAAADGTKPPAPQRLELSPDGAHLASRWSDARVRLHRLA